MSTYFYSTVAIITAENRTTGRAVKLGEFSILTDVDSFERAQEWADMFNNDADMWERPGPHGRLLRTLRDLYAGGYSNIQAHASVRA